MPSCSVSKCHSNNRVKHGIQFHRFPKDGSNCQEWIKFCKSSKPLNLTNATICSLHFSKDDYTLKPVLKEGALPSVNSRCLCGKCQRKYHNKIDYTISDGNSSDEDGIPNITEMKNIFENDAVNTIDLNINNLKLEQEIQKRILCEQKLKIETQRVLLLRAALRKERKKNLSLEVKLNFEKHRQKSAEFKCKAANEALEKIFTPTQIQVLKTGQHPHRWDNHSIIKGLGLRASTSKRIYRYLRINEHLPIPSCITLTNWVQDTFAISPSETSQTLNLLKLKLENTTNMDKNVLITFDEMPLKPQLCYDRFQDQIYNPSHSLQIIVVKSILDGWTQPIMFCYDQVINQNIIFNIIKELEGIDLKVWAIVSDLSQKNFDLWNDLNISSKANSSFQNCVDPNRNVWMFADNIHLFLHLRDHILDYGMSLNGKVILHNSYFATLMQCIEVSQFKICDKISWCHLQARGQMRDQAWIASQLLSNTVAKTIRTNLTDISEGADFIECADKAFDVFNSITKSADKKERSGFGCYLTLQMNVLEDFENFISQVRFGDQTDLVSFQEGFIVSIRSLRGLFKDLKSQLEENFDHLLTNRISLECVNNVFNNIRSNSNDSIPNAAESKVHLRKLLIGGNKDLDHSNYNDNNSVNSCISSQVFNNIPELVEEVLRGKDNDLDILLPEEPLEQLDEKYAQLIYEVLTEETIEKVEDFSPNFSSNLPYIYAEEMMEDNCDTLDLSDEHLLEDSPKKKKIIVRPKEKMWMQILSNSGFKMSTKWNGKFRAFEDLFNNLHNYSEDYLSRENGIVNKLVKILNAKWPKLDSRILKRYARLRTQIRLRYVLKKCELPTHGLV